MNCRVFIYLLVDAEGRPRYVGKTICLSRRLSEHQRSFEWVSDIILLEVVPPWKSWKERETHWIAFYSQQVELANKRLEGGAGGVVGTIRPPESLETRKKKKLNALKFHSETTPERREARAKAISDTMTGTHRVITWGSKISAALSNRTWSPERRKNHPKKYGYDQTREA